MTTAPGDQRSCYATVSTHTVQYASVCRRYSILWPLFCISSSVSANPSLILCRWPRKLVRFSSTAD